MREQTGQNSSNKLAKQVGCLEIRRQLADARQNHPQDLELDSPCLRDLLPDRWAQQHPQSIRQARVAENIDRAEAKRARRALRRQELRRQQQASR
jgi:hypothetical protein